MVRYVDGGVLKHDYYLSNAARGDAAGGVRAGGQGGAPDRGEPAAAKSEAGLGAYQVRNWLGWHHHMTLSLDGDVVPGRGGRSGEKKTPARQTARMPRFFEDAANCFKKRTCAGLTPRKFRPVNNIRHLDFRMLSSPVSGPSKKKTPGADVAAGTSCLGDDLSQGVPVRYRGANDTRADALAGTKRAGETVPLQST